MWTRWFSFKILCFKIQVQYFLACHVAFVVSLYQFWVPRVVCFECFNSCCCCWFLIVVLVVVVAVPCCCCCFSHVLPQPIFFCFGIFNSYTLTLDLLSWWFLPRIVPMVNHYFSPPCGIKNVLRFLRIEESQIQVTDATFSTSPLQICGGDHCCDV